MNSFQAKLVIVGHREALLSYEPFKEMIQFLQNKNRVIQLQSEDIF
jgi:hypothetical protein